MNKQIAIYVSVIEETDNTNRVYIVTVRIDDRQIMVRAFSLITTTYKVVDLLGCLGKELGYSVKATLKLGDSEEEMI